MCAYACTYVCVFISLFKFDVGRYFNIYKCLSIILKKKKECQHDNPFLLFCVSESFALLGSYAEGINNKCFLKTSYCPKR